MHLRPTRAMHSTGTAKHKDLANAVLAAKRTARSTEQAIMTERKLFRRLAPNFHFKIFNSSQDHYNLLVSINMDSVCAVGYNFSLQIGVASAQALGRSRRVEMLSTPSLPRSHDQVSCELPSREARDSLPIVCKPEKNGTF